MHGSLGQAYGADANAIPQSGEIAIIRTRIGELVDRVSGLGYGIGELGDNLFGATPEAVQGNPDAPSSHSEMGMLCEQVERLRAVVEMAETKFQRLRTLA